MIVHVNQLLLISEYYQRFSILSERSKINCIRRLIDLEYLKMHKNQSNSPETHKFSARKPDFDLSALSGEWHRDSAFLTAWENAFSMLFPLGEQSFINSVIFQRSD